LGIAGVKCCTSCHTTNSIKAQKQKIANILLSLLFIRTLLFTYKPPQYRCIDNDDDNDDHNSDNDNNNKQNSLYNWIHFTALIPRRCRWASTKFITEIRPQGFE